MRLPLAGFSGWRDKECDIARILVRSAERSPAIEPSCAAANPELTAPSIVAGNPVSV